MNAGDLDTKITIQSVASSPSAIGDVIETFSTLAQVWAKVVFLKGSELVDAKARIAETDTKFVVWYSSQVASVNAQCRIVVGGVTYEILEVLPIPGGRPEKLEILAKRRAD